MYYILPHLSILILKKYNSKITGLTSLDVIQNRKKYGVNEIEKQKKSSFFRKFLLQFKNFACANSEIMNETDIKALDFTLVLSISYLLLRTKSTC